MVLFTMQERKLLFKSTKSQSHTRLETERFIFSKSAFQKLMISAVNRFQCVSIMLIRLKWT